MSPEAYLCSVNPEADPDEIARFVSDLGKRGLLVVPPDETIPEGCTMLSSGEIVRLTNPVVWSRPPQRFPVALVWMDAHVYERDEDPTHPDA